MIRITIKVNEYPIAEQTFDHKPGWFSSRVFSGADFVAPLERNHLSDADRIDIKIEEITE
jgi:hypothetical protein